MDPTPAELKRYLDFAGHHTAHFSEPPPDVLWHYTNGTALTKIIENGSLYATPIACLNDYTELSYAIRLLREAIAAREPNTEDEEFIIEKMTNSLSEESVANSFWFVSCLSAERDHLSQWRAYSGGENGYAIGFDGKTLNDCFSSPESALFPVSYDLDYQQRLASDIADWTIRFFVEGYTGARRTDREGWASGFLRAWQAHIGHFGPLLKDPAFESEREWRILHKLTPEEALNIVVLQKSTMLARHLPLDIRSPGTVLMPLASVMVGPSRHKEISRVGVGDLLRLRGYSPDIVALSDIPFRMP